MINATTPVYQNDYGIELQGDRLLVRKFDTTGFSAASGLILQSGTESREFKDFGQILLVGPGKEVDGVHQPMPFIEGQTILIRDGYNVESVTIGSEKMYIVMQESVQAVLHNAVFEPAAVPNKFQIAVKKAPEGGSEEAPAKKLTFK